MTEPEVQAKTGLVAASQAAHAACGAPLHSFEDPVVAEPGYSW